MKEEKFKMKKEGRKTVSILACIILLVTLSFSCNRGNRAQEAEGEVENIYAVQAYQVEAGNLDDYLEFGGDVSSLNEVDIYPDVTGKISRIVVVVGDSVKKDQPIAYVDPSTPGMNYAENPVKSTITGTVTSFPPTLGTTVSPSYSIAKVSDTDELQIKVSVPERFISRIKEGQVAVITFDSYPGDEFYAHVFEVSPVLDTVSRTMLIKLKVDPPDARIRAGMYARVKLVTDVIENAVVVPNEALVYRDAKPYIFVVHGENNQTVSMVSVKLGLIVDNKVEVQYGLSDGDIIVTKGQSLLSDGAKVKVLSVSGKSVESNSEEN